MTRLKWTTVLAAAVCLTGCSSRPQVQGVVTLDGTPVEGATVSFISADGKDIFTGFTDASGKFTLQGNDQKPGAAPGTYKVTVVKTPAMKTGPLDPNSPDYMKEMQKEYKEGAKHNQPKMAMGKMPMPGAPMMGGAPGQGIKSELPVAYALAESTPLTVKVPPEKQPIPIELKSK